MGGPSGWWEFTVVCRLANATNPNRQQVDGPRDIQ